MRPGQASLTAIAAAGHRAAHQALEGGSIFSDPLALPILGADAEEALRRATQTPARRFLRKFIAMRSRFAEECCRRAIARGVRQVVILGAGLDTFAYRLDGPDGLRIYEVDHPDTQDDKLRRLADAGIMAPDNVVYVGHDFERNGLTKALAAADLDPSGPSFVLWLGVTPYLTPDDVLATLTELAALPGGVEIVFDYANPPDEIEDPRLRAYHERMAAVVAAEGEPFRGFFETPALHADCLRLGYREIEDLDRAMLTAGRLSPPDDAPRPNAPRSGAGPHIIRVRK